MPHELSVAGFSAQGPRVTEDYCTALALAGHPPLLLPVEHIGMLEF
jgi:hypothetical protein